MRTWGWGFKWLGVCVVQLEAHPGRQTARDEGDDETHHRGQGEFARRGRADDCKVVSGVDKCPFKALVSVVATGCLGDGYLKAEFELKEKQDDCSKMAQSPLKRTSLQPDDSP
jgi:hypothetical protein